ncbi:MAG: CARDB domain-containing protein, partial [Spirochaetaceae bacterium]
MRKSLLWIPLIVVLTTLLSGCPGLFNALSGGGGDQPDPQADLAVGAIEFSVDTATGQVTGVEFIISNDGDAPALNADYVVVLSSNQIVGTNSSDDITIYEESVTLDAGAQETISLSTEIQTYIDANGVTFNAADYYVGVIVDPGQDIDESNEQNNTGVSTSTGFIGGASGG